ncbi:MAG TPA: hypothetical protein PKK60_03660 [archaeon]|nr:hypothetical protein [archaeon]
MDIKKIFSNKLYYLIWILNKKPVPPPQEAKSKIIKNYQKISNYTIFIETGTYLGEMIENQLNNFEKIYSIELSKNLYKLAKNKFKDNTKIVLLQGDSGTKLKKILQKLTVPAIFWLDAHYSEGITAKGKTNSPIVSELKILLKNKFDNIILIDDINYFGTKGYPTIKKIESMVNKRRYKIKLEDNIIQITPIKLY